MNDSAGAFVPAGIGGLDGYAEAFTALRKISGVVPSIMCMFGYNAGGGSYLPRQGSFMIQPADTFFGLTGPGVVKSVLGEDVTPDDLGGPSVHGASGVADLTVADEVARAAHRAAPALLPARTRTASRRRSSATSDPIDRPTTEIDTLLRKAFNSPTGFNTPLDVTILIERICDHGDYFELQPDRARNAITAFGRLGGHVVGFVANNSAVASGQIDVDAAYKIARFVRFCSIYNMPVIFIEDTTGFLPGRDQESARHRAGRARHARRDHRPAHAAHPADPAQRLRRRLRGVQLLRHRRRHRARAADDARRRHGHRRQGVRLQDRAPRRCATRPRRSARPARPRPRSPSGCKAQEAELNQRYERELMNPREALSSARSPRSSCRPTCARVLAHNLEFLLRHYVPGPMVEPQREFH